MTPLATETRTLYTDCLTSPDGYTFDRGLATSFTLSLETLLVLPFTLATQDAEQPERLLSDPLALLEALRETSDRLAVFHHDGYISVPAKQQLLYGLLDHCVVPVRASAEHGLFHPKLWLLRFVGHEPADVRLRAVVLSRNLTFDRSWDSVLCMDGHPTGRRVKDSVGLETLVLALPGLARGAISDTQTKLCELLADEAARTRFEPPPPFREGPVFHAIGVENKQGKRLRFQPRIDGDPKRLLCVSPFLSSEALSRARASNPKDLVLITRDEWAQRLPVAALEGWDVRVLSDAVETGESADATADLDAAAQFGGSLVPPSGLHAKIVIYEDYQRRVSWFLGSANLTGAGWNGLNVELMVELRGRQKDCGIDAFMDGGLAEILEGWTPVDAADPEQKAKDGLLSRANNAREQVTKAGLSLTCSPHDGDASAWSLSLRGGPLHLSDGITASAWPISLARAAHIRPLTELAFNASLTWTVSSPAELTSLVAVEISAEADDLSETIRFALRLPIDGLPENRDAHILRTLVRDQRGFFRYLRYLLSAGDDPIPAPSSRRTAGAVGQDTGAFMLDFEQVILEDLVRALSRNPERLRQLDRRIADLLAAEDVAHVVPEAFLKLWDTVRAALPKQPEAAAK